MYIFLLKYLLFLFSLRLVIWLVRLWLMFFDVVLGVYFCFGGSRGSVG